MAQTREMSWEDDEEMLALLEQKKEMEKKEHYNAPETMARKRKAVREAAISLPAPKSSTDLDFDDDVEPIKSEPEEDEMRKESSEQNDAPRAVRVTTTATNIKVEEVAAESREKAVAKARRAAKKASRKRAGKTSPRRTIDLPTMRLDTESFAKKSKAAQRRSRQRLRRLEKEQDELLSSQLQVV